MPRLDEELRIRHANGTFTRWLDTLKNTDDLLLDDWGMTAMDRQTRSHHRFTLTGESLRKTVATYKKTDPQGNA